MSIPRTTANPAVAVVLPPVEAVDTLAPEALVAFATQTAALHARAMARLTLLRAPSTPTSPGESLTAGEVAQVLNAEPARVCRRREQELGGVKLDGIVRFPRRHLDAYIARQRRLT